MMPLDMVRLRFSNSYSLFDADKFRASIIMDSNRHEFRALGCNLYVAIGYCNVYPLRHVLVEILSVLIYVKMSMSIQLRRVHVEFNLKESDYSSFRSRTARKDYRTSNCFPLGAYHSYFSTS